MPFLLSLVLFSWVSVFGAELQIPALTSPVMDETGLLAPQEKEDLSQLAYEIHTNNGPQITVFLVNDLQGYPIEDFSIRVAEKWQLGSKEKDNGLLIIISKAERKMRIEVGNGIEGEVTDYDSNRYIRDILVPHFRESDFYGGLKIVMEDIAKKFNIQIDEGKHYIRRATPAVSIPGPLRMAFPFIIGIIIVAHLIFRNKPVVRGAVTGAGAAGVGFFLGGASLPIIGFFFLIGLLIGIIGLHNLLFALMTSSGRGRGGYGGGGFGGGGGGGWSGGGGGFSGGGSSGNW